MSVVWKGAQEPVMITSSPSFKKLRVSSPPKVMLLDPLHDSSSMDPKLSAFCLIQGHGGLK